MLQAQKLHQKSKPSFRYFFTVDNKLFGTSNIIYVSGFESMNIPHTSLRADEFLKPMPQGRSPFETALKNLNELLVAQNSDLVSSPTLNENTKIAFVIANGNGGFLARTLFRDETI